MRFIFFTSIAVILYTYIGYPLVIWILSQLKPRPVLKTSFLPSVSVVIACHNEAGNITRRIDNLNQTDYPGGQLEFIVVSDGSTDRTDVVASNFGRSNLRVESYPSRKGKAAALNAGVARATGEIIVFADARQRFDRDTIRQLAMSFSDAEVGAVSGELILTGGSAATIGEGAGSYWRYEKWLRKSEARFDSCIGATGAVYAIRRELWRALPDGTILDDVYTPMRIARAGYRVVFEPNAKAYDQVTPSTRGEFARKVRTLTGNYQLCQLMPGLLLPSYRLVIQFYSHKLLRLAAPLLLLVLLISNAALAVATAPAIEGVIYSTLLGFQTAFYAGVMAGWYCSRRNIRQRLLNIAYAFSVMNLAALVGLFHFLTGKQDEWVRGK